MDITKKKKVKSGGKEYDMSKFDDTHSWSKAKKSKTIKSSPAIPNLLGRIDMGRMEGM